MIVLNNLPSIDFWIVFVVASCHFIVSSSHIDFFHKLLAVDLATHKTASGVDFYTVNPKGNVPTLVLDDGTILNENAATLQYISDLAPGKVGPASGTLNRYKLIEVLSYIGSEVHPSIGGLFARDHNDGSKELTTRRAHSKLAYLNDKLLAGKDFLVGDSISVADIYLAIVLSWSGYVGVDLSKYTTVTAWAEKINAHPGVKSARALVGTTPSKTVALPKLYYTPTSCGVASFISAHIAGISLDCESKLN